MDALFPERIMYGSTATSIGRNRSRPAAGQSSSSRALESPTALGDVLDGRTTPPRSHHAHCIRSPTRALTAVARAPAKLGCPIPAPSMCQQAARIKALSGRQRGRNGGVFLSSSPSEPAAGTIAVPSGRVSHGGRAGEPARERGRRGGRLTAVARGGGTRALFQSRDVPREDTTKGPGAASGLAIHPGRGRRIPKATDEHLFRPTESRQQRGTERPPHPSGDPESQTHPPKIRARPRHRAEQRVIREGGRCDANTLAHRVPFGRGTESRVQPTCGALERRMVLHGRPGLRSAQGYRLNPKNLSPGRPPWLPTCLAALRVVSQPCGRSARPPTMGRRDGGGRQGQAAPSPSTSAHAATPADAILAGRCAPREGTTPLAGERACQGRDGRQTSRARAGHLCEHKEGDRPQWRGHPRKDLGLGGDIV
ncbi:hypothetical protein IscW_ISCW008085 [Ixodes scapularis]|uniref:Uncharacterized protein n=1 Tax=Ixodes scapularis TaxID=6945 RepID=B7PU58_IXOSC|nr:hypothetical protein IscW_ISCW008085 [Ixodes scapularis]|eukprot:XP_002405553.1 hypothetical protein IscW_ISCW008085 [Ixodes scapularis]